MFNLKSLFGMGGSKESPSSIPEPKKIKQKTKETAQNLVKVINDDSLETFSKNATDVEILGAVYKMMVKNQNDDKLREEMADNQAEQKEISAQKRHEEIIKALSSLSFGKGFKTGKQNIKEEQEQSDIVPDLNAKSTPKVPDAAKTPKTPKSAGEKAVKEKGAKPEKVTKEKGAKPGKVTKEKGAKPEKKTAPAAPSKPTTPPKVSGTPPVPKVGTAGKAAVGVGVLAASNAVSAQVLAAANITIHGETRPGATLAQRVGQVAPNDPEPGVTSYGMLGMNSGARSQSIQSFVAENPQFGFKNAPPSKQFDDEFRAVANTRTQEMYDAQLKWYEKHVYNPTVETLSKSGLPKEISSDERVISYMSDRADQMGAVALKAALNYAKDAKTPAEFIEKISDYDLNTIEKSFAKSISNAKNPENFIRGLKDRVNKRKRMSQEAPVVPNVVPTQDSQLGQNSIENRDLNESLSQPVVASNIINQNNFNMFQPQHRPTPNQSVDDRSAFERKNRAT